MIKGACERLSSLLEAMLSCLIFGEQRAPATLQLGSYFALEKYYSDETKAPAEEIFHPGESILRYWCQSAESTSYTIL